MAMQRESGFARVKRLMAETLCGCGGWAEVSLYVGSGKYEHVCGDCLGWADEVLARMSNDNERKAA